jgi:hypothetical protein
MQYAECLCNMQNVYAICRMFMQYAECLSIDIDIYDTDR